MYCSSAGPVLRDHLCRSIEQRFLEAELKFLEGKDQFGGHGVPVEIQQDRRVRHRVGDGRRGTQERGQQNQPAQAEAAGGPVLAGG